MRKRYILISIIRKIKTLKSEMEQDRGGVKLEFVRFDSKICDLIDSKVKNNSKNSIKINSKFVQFDSTPPLIQGIDGHLRSFKYLATLKKVKVPIR